MTLLTPEGMRERIEYERRAMPQCKCDSCSQIKYEWAERVWEELGREIAGLPEYLGHPILDKQPLLHNIVAAARILRDAQEGT